MKLSQTKEIHICSLTKFYLDLEENLPESKAIAILFSVDDINHPRLESFAAVHRVYVVDIENKKIPYSFNYFHGLTIKEFLDKESDFTHLYVCCDRGDSRSAAMAAAIMRYYGNSDKEIWADPHYHPNRLVYKKQLKAFGIRICPIKLRYLKYLNKRAFRKGEN